jgi:phosphoglycolate phosphatase-like HAD superfamily hydrolase
LSISGYHWIQILNPDTETRLGHVRHALFDFDGTISVLRQGWEPVMEAVMLEAICPNRNAPEEIASEVRQYIDLSTGQVTMIQMRWLAEAVRRLGQIDPLSPKEYKDRYLQVLMISVSNRLDRLEEGVSTPHDYLIAGVDNFLANLASRDVKLYIASGSDHPDVLREANALGIADYITGGIYGALDASESNAKDRIIQRILDDNDLSGDELLVVGDGPVEIAEARLRGAISLGIASNEVTRRGWNQHKMDRLTRAGADLMVADFTYAAELVDALVEG